MKRISSRRQRLALGASVVAALLAVWRKLRRPKPGQGPVDPLPPGKPVVTVKLEREGQPYGGKADVALVQGNTTVRLEPAGGGAHRGEVGPGSHRLVVGGLDAGAVVPERTIDVGAYGGSWTVAVQAPDEPFIRLGGAVIPFRPRPDLVSVAIAGRSDPGSVRRLSDLVAQRLGWRRVDPDTGEPDDGLTDEEGLLAFKAGADAGGDDQVAVLRRLASEAGIDAGRVRVGFLVEGDRQQLAMLDGEFVFRFEPDFIDPKGDSDPAGDNEPAPSAVQTPSAAQTAGRPTAAAADAPERVVALLRAIKAELVQPVPGLPWTYLVRFADRDFRRHLSTVERLRGEGVLRYGEPNLAARIRDAFSLSDYQANRNTNLDRMGIEAAWTVALAAPPPAAPVKIGTHDRGVDVTKGFIDDLVVLDFTGNVVSNHVPENDGHGMKVASLASGNGAQGCWGVAPFLPHVAIQRTSTTDVRYWEAFDNGFVPQGVQVVSISHESEWLCADQTSQDKVTAYVNAGMVIVVAAGNADRRLDRLPGAPDLVRPDVPFGGNALVSNPIAAHPRTITVGNTMLNTIGAETFWKVSGASPAQGTNRGDFVDVCAFGDGTRAMGPAGSTSFTGTSAAAPLVAGTVALMRHVNPNLTVAQIRAILCSEIDAVQPTDPQWLTLQPTWASPGADWDFTVVPVVGKHNLRYGFGRINVGRAVAKARSLAP